MSVIEIQNLTRDYGDGRGVFDLSFSVENGEVFGFLGPNGAGKTTTIRHLMGFLQPKSGTCSIGGLDCWRHSAAIQKKLGYIPGEINFFDDMTGTDFLEFVEKYRDIKFHNRKKELLDRFEFDPRGKLKKMSKGMKQKAGIVVAFMHDPDVLILDEPTSGLDPLMQNRFIELVIEEKTRGKTILMSSHMFEEVERTCHRVGIIRDGKLAAVDSVDALKAAQVKKYVITFENSQAAKNFANKENLQTEVLTNHRVVVTVRNNIQELIAVMNRYPVANLSAPTQSLEEIFMQYYGGAQ
ncbi:ABC transporter ATP-binding protein [Sinanaerobacter chloroacetimidivorans]|jgi:ABC-2 type transport system ATP-binding protein|uniref:ABC transporter ATP-binding protein n=1 Tax=Sinanaerobacter chloroacetimidivorans TaxID=2818044 RepID=A0A8J7W6J6_9FIRM|nr:ABC transporter ATP-binding protein [Sinanaerobacter chloroacetimidivorans]MBR0600018.1 ABC transporter ATP-binding protein [Sinanaerobacter chloroacetimidivorans]